MKNAAGNAGTLYTAKGTASLLVPLASILSSTGDWNTVFIAGAIVTITAAFAAKFILAPARKRFIDDANKNAGH